VTTPRTIAEAAPQLRAGSLRSLDLVEECLEQIDRFEAQTKAWVLVDADGAGRQARQLDDELRAGRWRGPLHGIPLGIKDIVDVAGWPTRAGSSWYCQMPASDATIVARLREAGAVLLGKTVNTEFACFDPSPTRNPWNPAHTPGGSSSGSAAAVARGMCLAAIGSQTGGSITRPATYCGVAGCKPTFGRVSRAGVLPVTERLDHPGPIARTALDLAIVLSAIAGPDPLDASTLGFPHLAALDTSPLERPPQIALARTVLPLADEEAVDATRRAVEVWRQAGTAVEEIDLPGKFDEVIAMHRRIMAREAADVHRTWFAEHRDRYGPKLTSLLEEGAALHDEQYRAAVEHQDGWQHACDELLAEYPVLVTPATTGPAPLLDTTGNPAMNSPWSYSGLPTVSLPCELAQNGLPLGVQLIGPRRADLELLRTAAWCEKRLGFSAEPPA
jgi:aspartyl-tRNA(Asn)/glutamyl-tRNA(Gln) amidotransferase subunit A